MGRPQSGLVDSLHALWYSGTGVGSLRMVGRCGRKGGSLSPIASDLDWARSPAHVALLRSFLEPRPAGHLSDLSNWGEALGEKPEQAIRRLLLAGALVHDDLGQYLAHRFTVAQLRDASKERGLLARGRKEELIARLVQADPDGMREAVSDVLLLRCSEQGREIASQSRAQQEEAVPRSVGVLPQSDSSSVVGRVLPSTEAIGDQGDRLPEADPSAEAKRARDQVEAPSTQPAEGPSGAVPTVSEGVADDTVLADSAGRQHAQEWSANGYRQLKMGQHQQAVQEFTRAIGADPSSAAYTGRALAYTCLGDLEKAVADYDRAIELEPGQAEAYHDRGTLHERLGDYQRALNDYDRAVELDDSLAIAYCGRGTAYRWLGETQQALESYGKAIELDPRLANAYSGRGDVYYALGDYARAVAEYDRAIKLDHQYAEAYHNRGLAYERLEDYRSAAADYRLVRELAQDPDLRQWVEERLQEVLGKLW